MCQCDFFLDRHVENFTATVVWAGWKFSKKKFFLPESEMSKLTQLNSCWNVSNQSISNFYWHSGLNRLEIVKKIFFYLNLKCPNLYNSSRVEIFEIRAIEIFYWHSGPSMLEIKNFFLCKSEISELIQTNLCWNFSNQSRWHFYWHSGLNRLEICKKKIFNWKWNVQTYTIQLVLKFF